MPICIITASGMVCASSKPMRVHKPHGGAACTDKPGPTPANDKIVSAVKATLTTNSAPPAAIDTMCTAIQVMLESGVDDSTSFTITRH